MLGKIFLGSFCKNAILYRAMLLLYTLYAYAQTTTTTISMQLSSKRKPTDNVLGGREGWTENSKKKRCIV